MSARQKGNTKVTQHKVNIPMSSCCSSECRLRSLSGLCYVLTNTIQRQLEFFRLFATCAFCLLSQPYAITSLHHKHRHNVQSTPLLEPVRYRGLHSPASFATINVPPKCHNWGYKYKETNSDRSACTEFFIPRSQNGGAVHVAI